MGDVWFYRFIFVALVVAGIVIPETIPLSLRLALVRGGIAGLIHERFSKENSDFERQRRLAEPSQSAILKRAENAEAFCRDLSLPADPNEGY